MKNCLVFFSSVNSPGKCDSTGAFEPEAKAFARIHKVSDDQVIGIACVKRTKEKRMATVLTVLDQFRGRDLEGVAFFGHGWFNGFQFGFSRQTLKPLALNLVRCCNSHPSIPLYACSTAENDMVDTYTEKVGIGTDGGFADLLRDELCRLGLNDGWIDAHKTAGHTTMNPMVVRFRMADIEDRRIGGVGGDWLVCPGSSAWKKWKQKLQPQNNPTFRFEFPFMSVSQIKSNLELYTPSGVK